jgi:hypothetical protein
MKTIKKNYDYITDKQIWRIIPSDTGKLLLEIRDTENKEAFFDCLDILTGQIILKNFQPEEKFWIGVESVYKDIIFFNKFAKPDMPAHKEIIACDITTGNVLWHNKDLAFLFVWQDKVYAYRQEFEGRKFYMLDYLSGQQAGEETDDYLKINELRDKCMDLEYEKGYLFPELYPSVIKTSVEVDRIISDYKTKNKNIVSLEFIKDDDMLYYSYYEKNKNGKMDNKFRAVNIEKGKVIIEETLMSECNNCIPDSFFIKQSLLFVLFGKKSLSVYSTD